MPRNKIKYETIGSSLNQFIFTDKKDSFLEQDVPSFDVPYMIATDASMCIIGSSVVFRFKGKMGKSFKVKVPLSIIDAYADALMAYKTNGSPLDSTELIEGLENKLEEIENGKEK